MEEPEEVTDSAHTKKESGDLFKEDEIIEYDWDPYKGKGEGSELAKELRAMVQEHFKEEASKKKIDMVSATKANF